MLFSGVSISDESIKLWSSIGSRKSNLKACLHAFTEDRKKIAPIERATVEKDDPKPWESFCSLNAAYYSIRSYTIVYFVYYKIRHLR